MPLPVFVCLLVYSLATKADKAPTWDECECRWEMWEAWSSCTATCGGGTQERSRGIWNIDTPECEGFEVCATADLGWQTQACNTQCFNEGSFTSDGSYYGYCSCPAGIRGSCCQESKFRLFDRVKSGKFGRSAKFGQRPCSFHI